MTGFAISPGFYFHETSHMQGFEKIKPSRKFPNSQKVLMYNQCSAQRRKMHILCEDVIENFALGTILLFRSTSFVMPKGDPKSKFFLSIIDFL